MRPKSFEIIFITYVYIIDIPTMGSHRHNMGSHRHNMCFVFTSPLGGVGRLNKRKRVWSIK